ncbi:outer membrane beta-barrel protein [Salegentibacter mishustinae]|uniref:Outer membrane protein beta-barrel domain-containing protein n=1 Tax=Salegentibacter mishustinae TaxID=270918 RepID=A0A0Q9ZJU4_9FLAO|nr:outer membrane beta-barrel protein [Salegentibacter mishustinae]KRG28632.1 hypothetical protein APR42_07615 [Salegentibacter mishustinae]PNW22562.1 hypothetical protein APB85_15375 [Salegentibacter mishustinae]PZX67809.1 putative outer membrane protein [Salegentibacter mishustinae]GGW77218.1 hypothetical protein GCM10008086_00690 [Salegentibacter mishustinae]
MKKILLSSILFLTTFAIFAQKQPVEEGTTGNQQEEISEEQEEEENRKNRFGVKAGYSSVAVDLGVISLSVDGFYAGLIAEFSATDKILIQPEVLYSRAAEANIIHGAVLAKYYVVENLSILAGPQATYFIGEEDVEDNSFGVDVAVGVGFDITDDLFADLKYAYGLTERGDENDFIPYKVNTFQIGLGYKF